MIRITTAVIALVIFGLILSLASYGSPAYFSRPGTCSHVYTLRDGVSVVLDNVWVDRVIGNYAFVRDPWNSRILLPIYTNAALEKWDNVEVRGFTYTISGTRIVVAQQVRQYLTSSGVSVTFIPQKGLLQPNDWPFMFTVPLTPFFPGARIPAPPDPNSLIVKPREPLSAPAGTVAAAKIGEAAVTGAKAISSAGYSTLSTPPQLAQGSVQLSGKTVSAVFYQPNTQTVTSFYIQEPAVGGNGIMVVPQVAVPVEPGNIVTVTGTVVPSDGFLAESYLNASSIECTGSRALTNPICTCLRSMASSAFGCQQGLYLQTENSQRSAISGAGLSLVGTRVRVGGTVTWVSQDNTLCFVDDGSNLMSDYDTEECVGIRVVFPADQTPSYQVGDFIDGITGVLGAEMSEDPTPQPVPVLRVARVGSATSHIWYVRPSPAGNDTTHTGDNWGQAFATVQKAVTMASAGDEVWVAAGTYQASSSGTVPFVTLKEGVSVYGGFNATETSREQRNWVQNVIDLNGNSLSYAVVCAPSGVTSATRFDGFSIRNAYTLNVVGGGIRCVSSSPVIANNTISGVYDYGTTCAGAGIACVTASPTIWNNTISGNKSYAKGGGVYCSGGAPTIANNFITQNLSYSGYGGAGIYCSDSTTALIVSNTIAQNSNFDSNSPTSSAPGVGIYCVSSSPTITRNRIFGNMRGGNGGGVYCSGGAPIIANNAIMWNSGSYGSGVFCADNTTALIANNTIVKNTTSGGWQNGGGLFVFSASPTVANNIIAFNSSGIFKTGTGTVALKYNDLWQNTSYAYYGLTGDATDIAQNPGFAGLDYGNILIAPNSACVNAVQDDSHAVGSFDIDGESRIQSTHLDMGADESDGNTYDPVPVVIHVSPSGNDLNDGLTWEHAMHSIQAGINAAAKTSGEVWVEASTYNENIMLLPLVSVFGGFGGSETAKSQRDYKNNVTIIDGGKNGSVVTIENVIHAMLDGFTIRNGSGWVHSCYNGYCITYGGGIRCKDSSPTISHCTITGNGFTDGGSGIYVCGGSSPVINSCVISDNSCYNFGGGIYASFSGTLSICNSVFIGNRANAGGAIYSVGGTVLAYNNTCVGNYATAGGFMYCASSTITLANNIVAYNSSIMYSYQGSASLIYNDLYENCEDYQGSAPTQTTGNISSDPQMATWFTGDMHIQPSSLCVDAGNPNYVMGTTDIDEQARVVDGNNDATATVDIGADEVADCAAEKITLTPATSDNVSGSSSVTLTANVSNRYSHQPLAGRRVDLTVGAGSITSIQPDEHLNTPPSSGWGTTDAYGNVTVTVLTPSDAREVVVTASTSTCDGPVSVQATINAPVRVGFLYNLCSTGAAPYICLYLNLVENEYKDVVHERINDFQSGIDSSFGVVVLALPSRALTTSELNALNAFVQSGRKKRLVLIGEHNGDQGFPQHNSRLNTIAQAIGMTTSFSVSDSYDGPLDRSRLCTVNQTSYLMTGVSNLWMGWTGTFTINCESCARSLAYVYSAPTLPWVVEEDTATAGSRITIHDTNIMDPGYSVLFDTIPYKNSRFVHNLCTLFPQ